MYVVCRRNLEFYDVYHYDAIQSCDSDCASSAGELIVKIPKAAYDSLGAFGEQYMRVYASHLCCICMICNAHTPGHSNAADEAWYWPKRI